MKKLLILCMVVVFATPAFAFDLPTDRTKVPKTKSWKLLGTKKVTQRLEPNGTITMLGKQKGNTQFISLTFKNEDRPYCYWFVSTTTKKSEGRCDIDNNGSYEYDFGATGRIGTKLRFKDNWPTAED